MTKYFKFIGEKKIVMTFDIPERVAIERGWTKLVEDEPIDDSEEMEEDPIEVPSVEEMQKPKRGRKPKTINQ